MSDSKIDCKQLEQLRDSLETMARNSDDFLKLHQGDCCKTSCKSN